MILRMNFRIGCEHNSPFFHLMLNGFVEQYVFARSSNRDYNLDFDVQHYKFQYQDAMT